MVKASQYTLHERLGAGGMGVVYRGTMATPVGRREVAIKQLTEGDRIDTAGRSRLIAEAQLVFRLTHTNICQVMDLGEGDAGTFVVMEYVRGADLRALLKQLRLREQPLDIATGVYIGREIARALDYAHRRTDEDGVALSLWHGDVTPQNVLLSVEGEVKLTDFGIARALGVAAPGVGLRAGTPGFVAPEAELGAGDHRSDIYGLGMSLAVALTGVRPDVIRAERASLRKLRSDLSHDLCALLARSLDDEPARRFLSALDVERALSVELARRDPTFTPSVLAALVRAGLSGATPALPVGKGTTIVSIVTAREKRLPISERADAPPRTESYRATSAGARVASRYRIIVAGLLALTLAGAWAATRTATHARTGDLPPIAPAIAAAPTVSPLEPERPIVDKARPGSAPGRSRHASTKIAEVGYVTVTAAPWASVFVDGHRVSDETPLYRHVLPAGDHSVRVRFQNSGPMSPPRAVRIEPGKAQSLGFSR